MRPPSRLRQPVVLLALVGQIVCMAGELAAQSRTVIQTAHRDTLLAEASAVVTVAFTVRNDRAEAMRAEPTVVVPKGWSVVVGGAPFKIAAKSRELWLIGIAPPATTPAGTYGIRASLIADGDSVVADSLFVRVPERRGLEVLPGEAPPYAMAGDGYPVTFFVRNRGNVAASYSFRASASIGSAPSLQTESLELRPGATATVSAQVANEHAGLGWRTSENIVQLRAADDADSTISSSVSLRTTIVPPSKRWVDQLSTVPAQLTLRSVGNNAGVSPAVLFGSGQLGPGSTTQVDFVFRAPVSGPSLFGERDEYRLGVTGDHYRVRLGDNLFGFSQLSSSWVSGFGAEARGDLGGVTAGAYVKENRWTQIPGSERAFLVGTSAQAPFSVSVIGLDRTGASGPDARMGAFTSKTRLGDRSSVELEGAMSDSAGVGGEAHRVRLSGEYPRLSYDLSMTRGTSDFAGRDRGQTTGHAGFSTRLFDWASFTANTSTLSYIPTFDELGFSRVRSTSVEGGLFHDRLGLVYEQMNQADSGTFAALGGGQRGGRVRANIPLGWFDLFADAAGGTARPADAVERRYTSLSMTLHASLQRAGSIEFFAQRSDGMLFETSGLNAATTAQIHLPASTNLVVSAYGNVPTGETKLYYAQVDAEISHTLRNGMTLALRDRMTNSAWRVTSPRSNLLFLELRAPLKIPTGIAPSTGMARGRIFDEETGQGVGGVLVRLGSEAAVTDGQGRVAFSSLQPGRYHASVDGGNATRVSDELLTGDVSVEVPSEARRSVDFSLSLARGGQVHVDVRQFEYASTLANSSADTLVDAGGFGGAMIALAGARDTIYQMTNQDGVADFRDVPAGRWTVQMVGGSLPDAHALDVEERAVGVKASEKASVLLRLLPKRRAIQFIEPPPVIVARPKRGGGE